MSGANQWGQVFRDDPILGRVKKCPGCRQWWPHDEEFYWKGEARCRACCAVANAQYHRRRKAREAAARRSSIAA